MDQELRYKLQLEAAAAQAVLRRAQGDFKAFGTNAQTSLQKAGVAMDGVTRRAGTMGGAFVKGLAAGAITAALAGVTTGLRQTISSVADLADESERLGVTTDQLQQMAFGFKLAGVEQAEFSTGMAKFVDLIGDAGRGTGALKKILQDNGIALRNGNGEIRSTNDLLENFADLIQRIPDEATRMSLITDAFGKGGKAMTLALANGRDGLRAMADEAERAGAVVDAALIGNARQLDDQFDSLAAGVKTFFLQEAVGLAALLRDSVTLIENVKTAITVQDISPVREAINDITPVAVAAAEALEELAARYDDLGSPEAAAEVAKLAEKFNTLNGELLTGKKTMEEYLPALAENQEEARQFISALSAINDVDMSGVMGALKGVGAYLDGLAAKAAAARVSMSGAIALAGDKTGIPAPADTNMNFPSTAHDGNFLPIGDGFGNIPSGLGMAPIKEAAALADDLGSGGGSAGRATTGLAALSAQAKQTMTDLGLAIATAHEKVKLGLMTVSEGEAAISEARAKAGGDIAGLIAQLDQLGPAGAAAAEQLRTSMQGVAVAWSESRAEMQRMMNDLPQSLAEGMTAPLQDFIRGTASAGDAFSAMGDVILDKIAEIAAKQLETSLLEPLFSGLLGGGGGGGGGLLGGLLGGILGFSKGGAFAGGKVVPFAKGGLPGIGAFSGGVVARPTPFALGGGQSGLMGEAGPEAILPLSRGADGKLGVRGGGGGGVVEVHIHNVPSDHRVADVQQSNGGGGLRLDVVLEAIDKHLAGNLRAGRGPTAGVLRQRGLKNELF